MKKLLFFSLFSFFIISNNYSQQFEKKYDSDPNLPFWAQLMYSESPDVGEVVYEYNKHYRENSFIKNRHTQYYKRWLRNVARDVNGLNSGSLDSKKSILENERNYIVRSKELKEKSGPNSNWTSLGPYDFDKDAASRSYAPGAAHVYTVEQSISNTDVLYAGTANAGLWKTTDKGLNWSLLTSDMMIGGIISIEIDYTDENVVYFGASGDVFKSTDGGTSWNEIGDTPFKNLEHSVDDIVMHPANNSILFLSSNQGFYRTTDGGNNWSQIMAGEFQEIEIHPTNNDIIYTIKQVSNKTEFYKSTDNGLSFTLYTNGWPSPGASDDQRRVEIAVTPASADKVYALATGEANGGSGLYGVYISTDAGETWTFQCCGPQPAGPPDPVTNPNLMGWQDDGSDNGGQYYYDLGFEVSETDEDSIFVCGVNLWVSGDGGATFTCPAKWSHPHKPNYVHADIHDIRYFGSDLWIACDGGIFYSNDAGLNINRRMFGIEGTDFWGFGAGFEDGQVMLGGTYHNGTLLKDNDVYEGGWLCTQGGDNVRGFVNFGDSRKVYHDGGGKNLSGNRLEPITNFSFTKLPNASYIIGESSNIEFDPRSYNIVYSGQDNQLWKSYDNGASFELIHTFAGDKITSIEVAWADPDVIYVVSYPGWWDTKKLWKTTDGGDSWSDITPSNFSTNLWAPFDITVDGIDPDIIWLVRTPQSSGYNNLNGEKVYKSTNGGTSWTNLSTSTLDGEYITNIEHQRGTDGGVYIGTRRSVYYRNNSLSDWQLFNNDLPARTASTQLVPYYRGSKIRNGTNRSVFECDFYEDSEPIAQIAADKLNFFCVRDTIYFVDHSALSDLSATWSWSFPGANTTSSSERNPKITYTNPGTYDVSLTVTDQNGSDSQTLNSLITVTNECSVDTVPGNALQMNASGDYARIPELDLGVTNVISMSAWIKPNGIQPEYTGIITGSDGNTFGFNFRPNNELGYHWPGGQWWWSSGLTIPADEWSHVAIVANASSITVYLNGEASVHNISPTAIDFSGVEMYLGSYLGWGGRNYTGIIDEVAIWNKDLTQEEIRDYMHLTKKPSEDPDLLVYYQCNRESGIVTDRVGINHANLVGNTTRITSTAPVGGGTSFKMDVTSGGIKDFTGTGIILDFPASGTYPDGEVVVSRINLPPDQNPDQNPISRSYWVINNHGNNSTFSELESIHFDEIGQVDPSSESNPSLLALYKRSSTDDGATWNFQDKGDAAVAGPDGSATFSSGNGITSFSQFVISQEAGVVPLEWLSFTAELNKKNHVLLKWSTLNEINVESFIIERSNDGVQFFEIESLPAGNNSSSLKNYETKDISPLSGVSFYRVKQIDFDGEISYSSIKQIVLNALPFKIVVYPNPVLEDKLLNIRSSIEGPLSITIFNSDGKKVFAEKTISNGVVNISSLSGGFYYYNVKGKTYQKNGSLVVPE